MGRIYAKVEKSRYLIRLAPRCSIIWLLITE